MSAPGTIGPDGPSSGGHSTGDTTQIHRVIVPEDFPAGALTADHRAAIDALPPGSALLVVHRGPQAGARFLLNTPSTTAGRHPQQDIFLDDATVSRKHAVFVRREGGFTVQDEASLNGTYVNGVAVDSALLRDGDEIRIGKYRLTFHPSPRGLGAVPQQFL